MHDLECRVAAITAALAQEQMDRDRALTDLVAKDIYQCLDDASEDVLLQRERTATATNGWVKLEGRLSALNTRMTHSVYVGLEDAKRSQWESLHDELEQEVEPSFKLETHKADRREGSLFRRVR